MSCTTPLWRSAVTPAMQIFEFGASLSTGPPNPGQGTMTSAGNSRLCASSGTTTQAPSTSAPTANAISAVLRIEPLQQQPDRVELDRDRAREEQARERSRIPPWQCQRDQRISAADQREQGKDVAAGDLRIARVAKSH